MRDRLMRDRLRIHVPGKVPSPRALLYAPLPTPPAVLRQGPLKPGAFAGRPDTRRQAAWLGVSLGICFTVCFLTGLTSHLIQNPPSWFEWPARPAGLYRVTQGVHVATGLVTIPLLLAKLYTVYPRLFEWPPARSLAHAVERLSILVLVAGAFFQLATGVANIAGWYPFHFFFTPAHYDVAWITIGALVVHIGVKASITREALRRGTTLTEPRSVGLSRRRFLTTVGAAAGAVTLATVGETVSPLAAVSVLAPRDPRSGPQHTPVNRTARAANVLTTARDPAYRLSLEGGSRPLTFSYAQLAALPQRTVTLPITCVEGWSVNRRWTGVRLRDLLDMVGAPSDTKVRMISLERGSLYASSVLDASHARDPATLLALRLSGEVLAIDHGYPVRLIAPNLPGVLQTKWVHRVVLVGSGTQPGLVS